MLENSMPAQLRTDHLMLLVGTNPLPNYVAAMLLSRPDTKLHLVVTEETKQAEIHRRLITLLRRNPTDEGQYLTVRAADPEDIYRKVRQRVLQTPGSWGLHYTGGKKSMSTHAYRAMEAALSQMGQSGVYSYLDADTLELVVENGMHHAQHFFVHLTIPVNLEQILYLHGRPLDAKQPPRTDPFHAEFGRAMVEYCQQAKLREKWLDWAHKSLREENGKPLPRIQAEKVRLPDDIPQIGGKTLKELEIQWGEKNAGWLADWLHGKWLEDFVLSEAIKAGKKTHLHQIALSIKPKGLVGFEVDVAAMQGYRLFAIAVTTDEKGLAKLKLFEALIRARQMGGGEAKVALVTFSKSPQKLEMQVGEMLAGGITGAEEKNWRAPARVFGIADLPKLSDHLEKWFEEV